MIINKPNGLEVIEEFEIGEYHYQYVINPEWTPEQQRAERNLRFEAFEKDIKAAG